MFETAAIANEFLELGESEGNPISPMKLQKLVYFAHGWNLALFDRLLVNEQVECWEYGPVFRSLYRLVKRYGADPITESIESAGRVPRLPLNADEQTRSLIRTVWDSYKQHSAIKLSSMTHTPDGPWGRVRQQYTNKNEEVPIGTDIPAEWIREYFQNLGQRVPA